jgi:peptidoglycan/LPS O-acetylase OafA/YrhL
VTAKVAAEKKALHGLRGFMALLVLMLHLIPFLYADQRFPVDFQLNHAVDVFFVLSGYILLYVYSRDLPFTSAKFFHFAKHRIARIVPLAWLSVLIYFAIFKAASVAGLQTNHPHDVSAGGFVANLLFLDSNIPNIQSVGTKWSVSNEMVAYFAVFPLAFLLFGTRRKVIAIFLVVASFQAFFWSELSAMGPLFSQCIPEFLSGCLIFAFFPGDIDDSTAIVLALVGAAGFILAPGRFQVLFASLIVLSLLNDSSRLGRIFANGPMMFLGDISYSLYMLHGIFVIAVSAILRGYPQLRASYGIWILLPFSGSLATAYFSFHFWERPCRDWLKNAAWRPARS